MRLNFESMCPPKLKDHLSSRMEKFWDQTIQKSTHQEFRDLGLNLWIKARIRQKFQGLRWQNDCSKLANTPWLPKDIFPNFPHSLALFGSWYFWEMGENWKKDWI